MHIDSAIYTGNLAFVKDYIETNRSNPSELLYCLNSHSNWSDNSLHQAIVKGYSELVKLVLTVDGININKRGNHGQTYLMFAAEQGDMDVVLALLAYKDIDVNLTTDNGIFNITALEFAIMKYHIDIAIKLLQAGADVTVSKKPFDRKVLNNFFDNEFIENALHDSPSEQLQKFQQTREKFVKKIASNANNPLEAQKNAEQMQELGELSLQSAVSDIEFIQNNLDKIKNVDSIKYVVFSLANLLACHEGNEYDKISHSLYEAAAKMGHDPSKSITSHFPNKDGLVGNGQKLGSNSKNIETIEDLRAARLKLFDKVNVTSTVDPSNSQQSDKADTAKGSLRK